ncbi:hypothetical protein MPTK1_7g04580 [Marchantia polymorpha subsp. ruderalis]|uniref:ER membrane protein complex subunit 10 n=2 Tax=Marchantia polymorpha TaxID=3197 RepID=A0AAF6BW48_MARPO|nr:hypothetical protein MARPO_0062s0068 [Marchantia polymorpha]BBN16232.1 hypothetical protein Mp_7g04580 [Marchantia polymorpha subsp. ruderalis]|eukprot:PTQ36650.1 hypothetical protein MARPO_0062s0068 [Marchantia polymorpha]
MPTLRPADRWLETGLFVYCLLMITCTLDRTSADPMSIVDLSTMETRVLRVGHERKQDMLPLRGGGGKCVYELVDLEESFLYEVKISYPATIPSSFSLSLAKEEIVHGSRRLLNADKIIFQVGRGNSLQISRDETKFRALVLVTVEPEGVVAMAHVQEQEFVVYNIMLERVRLGGIPEQAMWVGLLAFVALALSFLAAQLFPSLLEVEQEKHRAPKLAIS